MSAETWEKLVLGLLALCTGQFALLVRMYREKRGGEEKHAAHPPEAQEKHAAHPPEAQLLLKLLGGVRPPTQWVKDMEKIAEEKSRDSMDAHENNIKARIESMRALSERMGRLQIQVAQIVDDVMAIEKKQGEADSRIRELEHSLAKSVEHFAKIAADIPRLTVDLLIAKTRGAGLPL